MQENKRTYENDDALSLIEKTASLREKIQNLSLTPDSVMTDEIIRDARKYVNANDIRYDSHAVFLSVVAECRDFPDLKEKLKSLEMKQDLFRRGRTISDDKGITLSPYQVLSITNAGGVVSVYDGNKFKGVLTPDSEIRPEEIMNPDKLSLKDISDHLAKILDEVRSHYSLGMSLRSFFKRSAYSKMLEVLKEFKNEVNKAENHKDDNPRERIIQGFRNTLEEAAICLAEMKNERDTDEGCHEAAVLVRDIMASSLIYSETNGIVSDKIRMLFGMENDAKSLDAVMEKIREKCETSLKKEDVMQVICNVLFVDEGTAFLLYQEILSCHEEISCLNTYRGFKKYYMSFDSVLNGHEKNEVLMTLSAIQKQMKEMGLHEEAIAIADGTSSDLEEEVRNLYSLKVAGILQKDDEKLEAFRGLLKSCCEGSPIGIRQSDFENEDRYVVNALRDSDMEMFGGLKEYVTRIELSLDELEGGSTNPAAMELAPFGPEKENKK